MKIRINAKQPGKRHPQVAACSYDLDRCPACLRELIRTLVADSVEDYNRRIRQRSTGKPLTGDALEEMSRVGKIAFGIPYGSREAEPEAAVETAMQGFADGLFRIFVEDREIESLDEALGLQEGDTITIIRLVMLTGGFFR